MIYTFETLNKIPIGSYGVIGDPVEHSMSPFIHNLFDEKSSYIKIHLHKEKLKDALPVLISRMSGFNLTIPHKAEIIKYLDEISDTAKLLGAVNTVKVKNGKISGFNTDLFGFETAIKQSGISFESKKILLLGAGGAAKTLGYASLKAGGNLFVYSRTLDKTKELCERLSEFSDNKVNALKNINDIKPDIILNATPVGMWRKTGFSPSDIPQTAEFIFDSIYNPVLTKLLISAKIKGIKTMNGSLMLSAQAAKAREIWGEANISSDIIIETAKQIDRQTGKSFPISIVLTGFMGTGKTVIGQEISKLSGLPFFDLDSVIEKGENKKISEIFKDGESTFRAVESKYLKEFLKNQGVLSLGGGTVCSEENRETIKNSPSFVFYLKSDFDIIMKRIGNCENRPLMKKSREEIEKLFNTREKYYEQAADFVINGNGTSKEISQEIYKLIKEII